MSSGRATSRSLASGPCTLLYRRPDRVTMITTQPRLYSSQVYTRGNEQYFMQEYTPRFPWREPVADAPARYTRGRYEGGGTPRF